MMMDPQRNDPATSSRPVSGTPRKNDGGALFGVPLGELGWFASLVMSVATGFSAFFLATFLAIVAFLILNSAGHPVDYALSYRRIGLPIGVVVAAFVFAYLGFLWTRRKFL